MKWTILTCLAVATSMSSCTSTPGSNDGDDADYVLMPSVSRNANRQSSKKLKEIDKEIEEATPMASTTNPSPTPAQQEAAAAQLQASSASKQASPEPLAAQPSSNLTPSSPQATGLGTSLRAEPVLHPEADTKAAPAPPPNEIELKGLRSPNLPNNLPMNF